MSATVIENSNHGYGISQKIDTIQNKLTQFLSYINKYKITNGAINCEWLSTDFNLFRIENSN